MAVQQTPKKLSISQDIEEIPIKKRKSMHKEQKNESEDENVTNNIAKEVDEIEIAELEKPNKKQPVKSKKDFKFLEFRKKLRGTNFIADIRDFLKRAQKPRFIAKYLEKRGKPLELVEALARINPTNVMQISYICEGLHLMLIEIVANQKEHLQAAEQACRYLLKTHIGAIDKLLNSPQLKHQRLALKLLTTMICVDAQLGRLLLNSCDILTNSHNIEKFLSHSGKELNAEETVRKCYIHFILAYFIDGNVLLAQTILDRPVLIRALTSGLQFDDHVTVCMVLNTLRKYVLECGEISKTKKFHVFDQDCCKSLVSVYDWYGPKVFVAKNKQKLSILEMQKMVNETELQAVIKALHEFLLLLLTSRKSGICFNALKHMDSLDYRQKHNVVPGKVIFNLYKPWKSVQKTELTVKILNACPELGRKTVLKFAGVVNFMRTPNPEWVAAVEFLTKLIDTLHPSLLESIVDKSTITDWTYWVKDVCLPMETLVLINKSNVLLSKIFQFRLATNRLLLAMFRQYNNYVQRQEQKAKELQRSGTDSLRRFKLELINHILVHFPPMEKILLSLNLTVELAESETESLNHLEICLDVILVICKKNREYVNKTREILQYLELLRPLYCTANIIAPNKKNIGNINVELKAVKTMLALFPKALLPGTDMFQNILTSFINAFVNGEPDISWEARKLLREIFKNTGFFERTDMEIDIWLEALRLFKKLTVDTVTVVFIEVLQLPKNDIEIDMPKSTDVSNKRNIHELFKNIEQGLSLEAYVEVVKLSPLLLLILKGVEITPQLRNYLEVVVVLLFHYIPAAADVLHIVCKQEFQKVINYMQSWLSTGEPIMLPIKVIKKIPYLFELQSFTTECNHMVDRLIELLTLEPNAYMLIIHVHSLLFLVTRYSENEKLTNEQAQSAATALIACLKIIKDYEEKSEQLVEDSQTDFANSILGKLMHYIYNIRLAQSCSLQLFGASNEAQHNFVHFVCLLTEYCQTLPDFANYGTNLRQKLVNAIRKSLQNSSHAKLNNQQQMQTLKLVECLNFNATHSLDMLQLLAEHLKPTDCLITENTSIKPSIYYKLIVCLLQQLATFKQAVDCQNFVIKFGNIYKYLIVQPHEELDTLEMALYEFLLISPHCISNLSIDIFQCFFITRKISKSTIKLATLLMERNTALQSEFLEQLPQQLEKRELIYALLQVAFKQKLDIPLDLLQTVYAEYKKGLLKAIEKPRKAIAMFREYIDCGVELIRQCMPHSECLDYCQKQLNCDAVEYYQIKLLHEIYAKANEQPITATITKLHVNYLNTLLQLFSQDLKQQQNLQLNKLKLFGFVIYDCLQKAGVNADFKQIQQTSHWRNLCKIILKLSLQAVDANLTAVEQAETEQQQSCLLQILALLCDHVYALEQEQQEAIVQNFDMLISHSQFRQILLQPSSSVLKTQVLHLMYVLCKKSTCLLNAHTELIVVVLAAYNARLYAADRYALALLELFEQHATAEFQTYRPFVWGQSAISYYSLRIEAAAQKLMQQETNIAHIMTLVDKQICESTLENFPIWRKLQTQQQMPQFKFDNPAAQVCHLGYSALQQELEQGAVQLEKSLMNLASSKLDSYEACYDPAFFVPLMSMCFAAGQNSHPARPVENGLLALTITALASQDADMRLAAACAQMRYRAHFEQHKFATRELWTQIYDNLQAGLHDLREMRQRNKEHVQTPRIPLYSALYVAKSLQLSNNPTHLLYRQLLMHLRQRSTFDFQTIPNFNVLFFSHELEHAQFRKFILEIIRHGLKSSGEVALLVMSNTLKVLLSSFGNVFSNLELTCLLLDIINKSVKIPATIKMLVEHVGIFSWLHTLSVSLKFHQFDVIEGLISILYNLWYSLRASQQYLHNFAFLRMRMHELVLHILPHLSTRISISGFSKILRVLQQTHNIDNKPLVSEQQLDQLINCAACHFPEHIHSIESIRKFGANCAESTDFYNCQLQAQNISIEAIIALSSLRSYAISWQSCQKYLNND